MFFSLDTSTQIFLLTGVVLFAFFIASAMDGVMGRDGFGVLGNHVVVVAGFYLGIYAARHYRFPVHDLANAVVAGLSGAFLCLFGLALAKALLNRFA